MSENRIVIRRRRVINQPLVLIPERDGEYDDEADIREMSDKIQEFLYGISKGYSMSHSCSLSGCKEEAMKRWLTPRHPNYKPKLMTLYKRAKAIFYSKQVDKVANARDWRAAAMWLERHEKEWNPKETTILQNDVPMIKMDGEMVNALSKAYDERMKAGVGHKGSKEANGKSGDAR